MITEPFDDAALEEDRDDDADDARSRLGNGWPLFDPYYGAPLGSPFSDD